MITNKQILCLIAENNQWPFLDWNTETSHYILLNLFWINYINRYNMDDWGDCNEYYINYDHEVDFSMSTLYIENKLQLKKISISPITNYEKKFDLDPYSISIFKEDNNESLMEYDTLTIHIDLSEKKYIDFTDSFIEYFLSKEYKFEKMEKMIEELDLQI